jgi:hypothetical protein
MGASGKKEGARDALLKRAGGSSVAKPEMAATVLPAEGLPDGAVGSLWEHTDWEGVVSDGGV